MIQRDQSRHIESGIKESCETEKGGHLSRRDGEYA